MEDLTNSPANAATDLETTAATAAVDGVAAAVTLDPVAIANASLAAIQAILLLIAMLKAQTGMTGDQIAVHAGNQFGANADQIKQILASLP